MTIRYLYGAPTVNAEVFWKNKVIINEWKIQYNSTLDVFFSPLNPYRILCPKDYLWASGASDEELKSNFDEIRNWSYGFAIQDQDIYDVLDKTDRDELQLIIDILLKKFSCAITKDCTDVAAIVDEIQKMGGDSIVNQLRQTGVKYSVIVQDVAQLMKVEINKANSIEEQENSIVEHLFQEAEAKMSKEDKAKFYEEINKHHEQQKVNSFKDIVGNKVIFRVLKIVIIRMILKELLTKLSISYVAKFASTRGFSILLGPVGVAAGALWTLFDLTGPAYSVTVPCVLIVALTRERLNNDKAEENAQYILDF